MTTTDTAHSVPPEVSIEGCGIDGDIPVITLDLSGGAIDRSILRGIYHAQGATSIRDARLDAVLASCGDRDVFRVDLDLDAAGALWQALGDALEVAEADCRQPGCPAVPTLDGLCPGHDEAASKRVRA